jgi:glucose/arabinose dehydrogenase
MRRSPTPRPALTVLAVLALMAAACGGGGDIDTAATTTTTATATTAPAPADVAPTTGTDVGEVRLVNLGLDLDSPVDLVAAPGGRSLLIAERSGTVREALIDGDGARLVDGAVVDLTDEVGSTSGERGLLGIAVSADGGELFASYTGAEDGESLVDAYRLTGDRGTLRADRGSRRALLEVAQPFANHNGGSVLFGPDGNLWIGLGDGGASGDPDGRAQDRTTLLGKIVRIDPRTGEAPPDNPFATGDGDRRIWATGLRNPWRMSFDTTTGDLWVADVGQNRFEEVNVLRAADGWSPGANLGWDLFEGTEPFRDADPAPPPASEGPFLDPVHTYAHSDGGCSVTGGQVVRDPRLGGLDGVYLFGDFCDPTVRAIRITDGAVEAFDLGTAVNSVVAFGQGPARELYVVGLGGDVLRIDPA